MALLTGAALVLIAGEAIGQTSPGAKPATQGAASSAAPVVMTLDQAVAAAEQNSPQVVQGQEARRARPGGRALHILAGSECGVGRSRLRAPARTVPPYSAG